ncbi:MAG TPA: O-antigen ligase family protein, partial [Acidimicrobiales bacterium]|nr:O-antigen ligase family protein [Acidimicrobiales bacterium]
MALATAPLEATTVDAPARRRFLPAGWAVAALVGGYPVWWLLGLGGFIWLVLAAPMAVWLVAQRRLALPRGFPLYVVFLCFVGASVVQVDTGDRLAGYLLRATWYLAAGILWLYLANTEAKIGTRRLVSIVVVLWLATVVGGWLGILLPHTQFASPLSQFLPENVVNNELVHSMVTPGFAEVQTSWSGTLARPKAPFFYTNGWGSAMALLTPFAIGALFVPGVRPSRRIIKLGLAASAVPIVLSLNRGLWVLLTLGVLYTVLRRSRNSNGRSRGLLYLVLGLLLVSVLVVATPLGDPIRGALGSRTADSNERRTILYEETISRTMESPFLGHGAPRPSEVTEQSVGTHGQLWMVMFSHGFVAAGLWMTMFAVLVWRTRNPTTNLGMALHVVLLLGMLESLFY